MSYFRIVVVVLISRLLWVDSLKSQPLLEENFLYTSGTALTSNGWTAHASSGTNQPTVSSTGLSYGGYASSDLGLAASIGTSGEDVHTTFTQQSSGSVYVSFIANFIGAQGGDYFFHLSQFSISSHLGRVWVKKDGSNNLAFGLSKSTDTVSYTGFDYAMNTTYLLVLKYSFVTGSSNDAVCLFVLNSGVPASEPSSPTIGPLSPEANDPSNIGSVALRQGTSTLAPTVVIDGIRVATTWSNAPLPVQLTSFSVTSRGLTSELHWATATETRNYGFEIERSESHSGYTSSRELRAINWTAIGFVRGHGTSASPQVYHFIDRVPSSGTFAYRLKQIDNDGTFEYYYATELDVGLAARRFSLSQNHPNPFNSSTAIDFTIPEHGYAALRVFNTLGKEVAVLFKGEAEGGRVHRLTFDASHLGSGIYFVMMTYGQRSLSRRMTILK